MTKRSTRSPHKETADYTCVWGLFGILRSCQVLASSSKLILNGRAMTRQHTDHPRRLDQLNEECPNNGSEVQEDKRKTKHKIIEGEWYTETDSQLFDCLAESNKRSRKNCCHLSLPHLSNSDTSSDLLSEYFQNSIHRGKYDQADRISVQQVQMSAKAIADQMFIDSLVHKQAKNFGPNSFSNALHVLNSDKDLFVDLLLDQNSLLSRRRKNTRSSQTEEETFKPELDLGTKTSIVDQPQDEIVILKPDIKYTKRLESVACHCSPGLPGRIVSDAPKTSFSFRGMKKRLKRTFGSRKEGTSHDCIHYGVDGRSAVDSSKTNRKLQKKQELNANKVSDIDSETDAVHKKLGFSGFGYSKKQEFDVILEAKRHISARLKNVKDVEIVDNEKSFRTLRRVLASPEHNLWPRSPARESQQCSCSTQMRCIPYNSSSGANECSPRTPNGRERSGLNPSRPNPEVASCDDTKETSLNQSTYVEVRETNVSATDNEMYYGDSINRDITWSMEITEPIILHKDNENDSITENEVFTSTMNDRDLPSTPSVCQLDVADANKFQEHQSPVSVLDPLFAEDSNSPQSIALQTALQLPLDFEECLLKSSPQDVSNSTNSSIKEQDHHQLSEFVHSVLQASCLKWDQLSETMCVSEELLRFDEVQFLLGDCQVDPKLLFDLINEVLLSIHQSHFCFPPRLASMNLKIMSVPLQKVVLDKIMTKSEFHLLPWTEKRTLDDIVSEDVMNRGSWLDVRLNTEQIVADISEDFLEECILDMILQSLA